MSSREINYMTLVVDTQFSYPALTVQVNLAVPSILNSQVRRSGDVLLNIAQTDSFCLFDTLIRAGREISTKPEEYLDRSVYMTYTGEQIDSFVPQTKVKF